MQPVAGPRSEAGRQRVISLLDLLDDAATGRGTVHFIADEPEPTRFSELRIFQPMPWSFGPF